MLIAIKIYFSLFVTFIITYFSIKLLRFKNIDIESTEFRNEGITSLFLICISFITIITNLLFIGRIIENRILNLLTTQLFTLSPVIIYIILKKEKMSSIGILRINFVKSICLGMISGMTFFLLIYLFEQKNNINIYSTKNFKIFLEYFIIAICEEILFRGYLQNKLVKYLGSKKGIIITAMIFSVFHFPQRILVEGLRYQEAILGIIALLPVSFMFGYIMYKTQNIMATSIFHTFINYTSEIFNI